MNWTNCYDHHVQERVEELDKSGCQIIAIAPLEWKAGVDSDGESSGFSEVVRWRIFYRGTLKEWWQLTETSE